MDVNWVIDRLPVTHSGRNNAQGLRSVNTIFRHHDERSHRPKVVCSHKIDVVHTLSSCMCASLLSTSSCSSCGTIHLKRNESCLCEVKPCEPWMGIAHEVKLSPDALAESVSSGCASALLAQHPHMVPHQFWLPLHCVDQATTRAYEMLVEPWLFFTRWKTH